MKRKHAIHIPSIFHDIRGLEHGHGKSLINGGFNGKNIYSYIIIWLVIWNHGICIDFPFSWEWNVIIPTDELHHFSEG